MAHAEYMNRAFMDRNGIVSDADRLLANVKFNTYVGIGISGTLVAPLLADASNGGHEFAIVRKDDSSHSTYAIEGGLRMSDRFVFVDDFVQSGRTLMYVLDKIDSEWPENQYWPAERPTMVGAFMYNNYIAGVGDGSQYFTIRELIEKMEKSGYSVPGVTQKLINRLRAML